MEERRMGWLGIVAVVLAMGLVASMWMSTNQDLQNQLQVTGMATMMVEPDQATVIVYVESTAKTTADAQQQNANVAADVVTALKAAGITADQIQTAVYSVTPEYFSPDNKAPVLYDYKATHGFRLTIKDPGRLGDFIDIASKAGANRFDSIQFELSDSKSQKIKQIVLANAAADAKLKGAAIAQSAGVQIKRIDQISEISYIYAPFRSDYAKVTAEAPAAPTPIEPGNVEVSGQLSMAFRI